MVGVSRNGRGYRRSGIGLAALMLSGWAPVIDTMPTLQDLQVAGHVLHFQQVPPSGGIIIAIVYNTAVLGSHDEAAVLATLLDNGLGVGDLVLQPHLVEQAHLVEAAGYGAIFTTAGVDQNLLGAALRQRRIPCLTRHLEQVEHGSCIVAICSEPTVSIVVNEMNAAVAGLRFATAFRMMVREI